MAILSSPMVQQAVEDHVSGSSGSPALIQWEIADSADAAAYGSSSPTHVVSAPPRTCLRAGVIQPANYKVKFGLAASTGEPRTYKEALLLILVGKRLWRMNIMLFRRITRGI